MKAKYHHSIILKGSFWTSCSGDLFRLEGEEVVNVTQDGRWKQT
ncbi:MAG: hypothetical protein OTI34_03595 [Lewinella sp.]|jgi:hypothetical protein|nr:hypothetical protein [Lewinella sp.]